MALVTVSNNSLTAVTALPASVPTGALTLIKSITASSSASISFVDGASDVVLDDTYKSYIFKFINIHPATDDKIFHFNMSVDSGSNYNVAKTTTWFQAYHAENDAGAALAYNTSLDLAQGTGFQAISGNVGIVSDSNVSGYLHLFNPSSTTFVKNFIASAVTNTSGTPSYAQNAYIAGYANTTSAVDAIQFKMDTGNIDDGIIKLYGVK